MLKLDRWLRKQISLSMESLQMPSISRKVCAIVFIVALIAVPSALLATHSWGGYHWARTTPQFTLKLGDNMTSADWKSHLSQASSDWNSPQSFGASSTPLLTAIVTGQSTKRCRMVRGTTQVCNGTY